jgi:mannosyltransferase
MQVVEPATLTNRLTLRRNASGLLALVVGLSLIAAAMNFSNKAIEHSLVSNPSRSLSWGPTLFRVLLAFHGFALLAIAVMRRRNASRRTEHPASFLAGCSFDQLRTATWHSWIALSALSVVALGLRLWHLNTDLWFDELLTLLNFVRLPLGDLVTSLPDQNNHLLFSVLSFVSVRLFGESAWAVRLPSVLFGVMSLWALFLLGRRVLGTRESMLACALMTVSYHHIWFSQNARGYMALLFFSLLATWLWLEALDRQSWGWWIAYSLAVTGGMLSHLTMTFVVAAHFLVYLAMLLWARRSKASVATSFNWRPFVAWTLCVSFTVQLYALALPEFLHVGLHEVSLESEWTSPWWVIAETLRNLRIGFSGVLVVACGGAMFLSGWLSMLRREWQTAVLMVLPAVLAGMSLLASGHNLWPRFFFFAMGFALLIAIHGAMVIPELLTARLTKWKSHETLGSVAGITLACLMIAASAVTVPRNYVYPKQDFTGAREYVESHRGASDSVVAVGLAGIAYGRYFAPQWSVAQTREELEAVQHNNSDVWLVYTLPVEVKTYRPEVWQAIQNEFEVVKVFPGTLGGGEVFVCRERSNAEIRAGL